ncbi:MAG TPA: hypothetical protein VF146_08370 [Bryobacteraceae bacterium]
MQIRTLMTLIVLGLGILTTGSAQSGKEANMNTVRVRYMVNAIDPAVASYSKYLGFRVGRGSTPNFALLSRGNLQLVLSTPFGPGVAAKPMSAAPGPGGSEILLDDPPGKPIELFQAASR